MALSQTVVVQTGTFSCKGDSGNGFTYTVAFDKPFATVPTVALEITASSDNNKEYGKASVISVSETQFTAKLIRSVYGTATFTVKWVASAYLSS